MSKAIDFLGVLSPSSSVVARGEQADIPMAYVVAPAVGVGIVGFSLFKKTHPLLGFLGGESVGANAYRLYRGEGHDRTIAFCGLGTQACAIAGSLAFKAHPFLGYLGGFIVGSTITALVPGSNAFNFVKR